MKVMKTHASVKNPVPATKHNLRWNQLYSTVTVNGRGKRERD